MNKKLTADVLSIHTTTVCTLKCAKCGNSIPFFQTPQLADIDKTIDALDVTFKVFDFIKEFRFNGGEAFLYPSITKLMKEIAKYKSQFEYAIIVTNGTYIPNQNLINTMKKLDYPLIVRVDNYGLHSIKYSELVAKLRQNNIQVDERQYTNDNQAFGGWIDLGDYTNKHYSPQQLQKVFYTCRLREGGLFLINDKLIFCCRAGYADLLGKVSLNAEYDFVDLLGDDDFETIRNKIVNGGNVPFEACKYCNGNDPVNSPRIPAAEQLE